MTDAVPDADAFEQRQPLLEADEPELPEINEETPDADAWEQALPVPMDDDDERR
jgi:hypothetical protein